MIKEHIKNYLEYCEINKRLTSKTIETYRNCLKSYSGKDFTCREIDLWIKNLNKSDRTTSLYVVILKGLIKWIRRSHPELRSSVCELIDIELPKVKKNKFDISKEEFDIVENCDNFLVQFLFDTGLRISEALSVRYSDIRNNKVTIRGKGGKIRLIFLSERLIQKLKEGEGKIFKFTPRTAQRVVGEVGEKIGVELWPHKLRHMFASRMIMKGVNIHDVSKLLGHSSVVTTEIYAHIGNEYLETVYKSVIK